MKKLLFLLLLTVYGYGQTLPSPKYNETTTNSLVVKSPNASSDFDPLLSRDPATFTTKTRSISPEYLRFDPANATISALGDSMTEGAGTTPYPAQLAINYGYTVVNMGVGGETSTQIKTRWLADPLNYAKPVIIWAGRNNFTDGATVKSDIASIVASLTHTNYLVVGIVNGINQPINSTGWVQITTLNNELKNLYGSKYVALREYIISKYNPSLPQDVIDHNNDVPANSIRLDIGHLNTLGNKYVAEFILQRIGNLFDRNGYLQSKDFKYYLNVLGGVTGSGVSNQVPFWTGANTLSGSNDLAWNNTTKGLTINGSVTGASTVSLGAGQNFFTYQRNLNFHSGGTSDYRVLDVTTLNDDGNNFFSVIGKDQQIVNNKNSASGNSTAFRGRILHNGTGSVSSYTSVDALISGSGTGAVTNYTAFNFTPLSPTNTIPITNYTILGNSGNFNSNIQNSYGVRIADLFGTVTARALDLNVTAGANKWNVYAMGPAKNYFNGSVLIGSTTDDGVNKLQVTGGANITGTINGVKTYTALIFQSGTSAPAAIVLGNNTVGSIVWTRTSTGAYVGTLSGAFTANKTTCTINNTVFGSITVQQSSVNTIAITTADLTGSLMDGRLTNNTIKIEVYP